MSDFPKKEKDRTNGAAVLVVGFASVALLWASVVALQGYFNVTEGEIAAERSAVGLGDTLRGLHSAQRSNLDQNKYLDKGKGVLKRLAMKHAEKAVLRDLKAGISMIPLLGKLNVASVTPKAGYPLPPATPVVGDKKKPTKSDIEGCDKVACIVDSSPACCAAVLKEAEKATKTIVDEAKSKAKEATSSTQDKTP